MFNLCSARYQIGPPVGVQFMNERPQTIRKKEGEMFLGKGMLTGSPEKSMRSGGKGDEDERDSDLSHK